MKIKSPITRIAAVFAVLLTLGFQQPAEHRTDVPDHPCDLILARPTDKSVTASLLAYKDSDAFIEYGTASGVYPVKTPVKQSDQSTGIHALYATLRQCEPHLDAQSFH